VYLETRPGRGSDKLAPMRRRHVSLAVSAAALLAAGLVAGCGSQGVASPTPQTVQGSVPVQTTPTVAKGNPANGKAVFAANGCAGCHTFKPAGSTANVGPPLDQLADYAKKANTPLDQYTASAITSPPPSYVPPGYPTNVMPTTYGTTIKPQQLADLVAFLTQKP
jgi:mono/diheme cytochrome c family protein